MGYYNHQLTLCFFHAWTVKQVDIFIKYLPLFKGHHLCYSTRLFFLCKGL